MQPIYSLAFLLLSLATATLLDLGVQRPQAHLMLVTRLNAATLLVSPSPFTKQDVQTVVRASRRMGFGIPRRELSIQISLPGGRNTTRGGSA